MSIVGHIAQPHQQQKNITWPLAQKQQHVLFWPDFVLCFWDYKQEEGLFKF